MSHRISSSSFDVEICHFLLSTLYSVVVLGNSTGVRESGGGTGREVAGTGTGDDFQTRINPVPRQAGNRTPPSHEVLNDCRCRHSYSDSELYSFKPLGRLFSLRVVDIDPFFQRHPLTLNMSSVVVGFCSHMSAIACQHRQRVH